MSSHRALSCCKHYPSLKLHLYCTPTEGGTFNVCTAYACPCCHLVTQVLVANGFSNDTKVVIAGLSNTYTHYITTFEEYQVLSLPSSPTLSCTYLRMYVVSTNMVFLLPSGTALRRCLYHLRPPHSAGLHTGVRQDGCGNGQGECSTVVHCRRT